MGNSEQTRAEDELERLRRALDAETRRCVEFRARLDRADVDFEEFVSKAAHNLRESLRDVASFSQLLAETYADRLDSEGGVFLGRIREGAARAQSLLTDVVEYWATSSSDRQSSETDMEAVLRQTLLLGGRRIMEQSAVVTHDPLPRICGDFDILAKVLHHLIKNAIQYAGKPGPRVHISCRRKDLEWVFSVQDNGLGVEPPFQGRIFGVFQRLHGKESPGHGLGLPFCKKAIERLGGRMWMESMPGAGSTFFFTLPPAD